MRDEVLEADAVEVDAPEGASDPSAETRALPARRQGSDIETWRNEVRTAAIAAAGGVVAGVATVAVAKAARSAVRRPRSRPRRRAKRERAVDVVASRSFLIDVHVLGR